MSEMKTFFKYVIPSILSFALSGVYAIVDGFFVGHSVGDLGLSAINVAYPVSAVLQAAGTGIGMGGAVYHYRTGCNAALCPDLLLQRKNASAEGGIREVRLTVKIHYKSRRLSLRSYNDAQYIPDHYKPVFYLLRRRSGSRGLCVYRVYYMYRLSDFSGSGRRKPADYQPLLWREEPGPAGRKYENWHMDAESSWRLSAALFCTEQET